MQRLSQGMFLAGGILIGFLAGQGINVLILVGVAFVVCMVAAVPQMVQDQKDSAFTEALKNEIEKLANVIQGKQ